MNEVKIIECPRDAMQGLDYFIPTAKKIEYINQLLKVGFDTIDFGSFVSPKAVPQMRDTHEVIRNLDKGSSKLLTIIANERGLNEALTHNEIDCLGYPFSISETFQKRNTNSSISQSLKLLEIIQNTVSYEGKGLVVYLSMGFGNPYGDLYDTDLLQEYLNEVIEIGIKTISIADTVGNASDSDVLNVFSELEYIDDIEIGAHLHSNPDNSIAISNSILQAGVKRIDTAIRGYGGCPFAEEELTGNLPTEILLNSIMESNQAYSLDLKELEKALQLADEVFNP